MASIDLPFTEYPEQTRINSLHVQATIGPDILKLENQPQLEESAKQLITDGSNQDKIAEFIDRYGAYFIEEVIHGSYLITRS